MASIILSNVFQSYNNFTEVLKGVNLKIEDQKTTAIIGASGSGKTTIIKLLAGILNCDSGDIILDDALEIGYVFQDQNAVFPNYTVRENVEFPLKLKIRSKNYTKEDRNQKVLNMLKFVNLSNKRDEYIDNLSGGEKQRVAIARALVYEPKILLLDEPLSYLDTIHKTEILTLIRKIKKEFNSTIVYVSHDINEVSQIADNIAIVDKGKILQFGTYMELYNSPNSELSALLLGGWNILYPKLYQKKYSFGFIIPVNGEMEKNKVAIVKYNDVYFTQEKPDRTAGWIEGLLINITTNLFYYEMTIEFDEFELNIVSSNINHKINIEDQSKIWIKIEKHKIINRIN